MSFDSPQDLRTSRKCVRNVPESGIGCSPCLPRSLSVRLFCSCHASKSACVSSLDCTLLSFVFFCSSVVSLILPLPASSVFLTHFLCLVFWFSYCFSLDFVVLYFGLVPDFQSSF